MLVSSIVGASLPFHCPTSTDAQIFSLIPRAQYRIDLHQYRTLMETGLAATKSVSARVDVRRNANAAGVLAFSI